MSKPVSWPLAIVLPGLLLNGAVLAQVQSPLRLILTLWFVLICPGMAFAALLPAVSHAAQLTLGAALSLAIGASVATAMLVAGGFSTTTGLLALDTICLTGCGLQVWRWARARPAFDVRIHA